MHHDKITFGNVSHLIFPFLYAPTVNLQLAAIIGCGKIGMIKLILKFLASKLNLGFYIQV